MWIIEFRNGSFFQNLDSNHGGRKETAQEFKSKSAAERFMRKHEWILANGGMAMEKN